jgi:hypothetical protein
MKRESLRSGGSLPSSMRRDSHAARDSYGLRLLCRWILPLTNRAGQCEVKIEFTGIDPHTISC